MVLVNMFTVPLLLVKTTPIRLKLSINMVQH